MTMVEIFSKKEAREEGFYGMKGAGVRNGKLTGSRRWALYEFVENEIKKDKSNDKVGLWITGQYVYVCYENKTGAAERAAEISTKALAYLKSLPR